MSDVPATSGKSEPQEPQSAPGATPTSSAGAEPQRSPAGAQDTGFRYTAGDGIPDWLVGKTPEEAAKLASQLYNEVVQRGTNPQPQTQSVGYPQPNQQSFNQQPQYYQPMTAPTQYQPPSQEDWLNDPGDAARRLIEYEKQTSFSPQMTQTLQGQAMMAREIVRQGDPESFKRWGPEIDMMLNQIDPQYRNVEAVKKVVSMVKADHIDELTREQVEREIQKRLESNTLLRPDASQTPGASSPNRVDFDSEELGANYRKLLTRYNVTPETLDEFLQGTGGMRMYPGNTLEERRQAWLKAAKQGDVITEEKFRAEEVI